MACNYLLAIIMYETTTVGPTLATSNPANLALIQDLTPDLVADPNTGVSEATVNAMMALITPAIPWWQNNGFSVTVQNLIDAGNLF
jgi:hypothetical protein